jgi:hypothetical protein
MHGPINAKQSPTNPLCRLELLAYHLSAELGLFTIPSQAMHHLDDGTPVNIQSMLDGVKQLMLRDWEQCLLPSAAASAPSRRRSDKKTKRTWATRVVHVNTTASYPTCFKNDSVKWMGPPHDHPCLASHPVYRGCDGMDIGQIVEMMAFDILIANSDRIHPGGGGSNNVHVVAMAPGATGTTPTAPWRFLWIDNGHMTFKGGGNKLLDFFREYCVFPSTFAELLLEPSPADGKSLGFRVHAALGADVVAALAGFDGVPSTFLTDSLAVVDGQLEALRKVAADCAAAEPAVGVLNILAVHADDDRTAARGAVEGRR